MSLSQKVLKMSQVAQNQNVEIANTIVSQLGGRRFQIMTGARLFAAIPNGVAFRLGRFPGVKINAVRITLNGSDLYDVCFMRISGHDCRVISEASDVYAEDLQRVFTDATGLDTHL